LERFTIPVPDHSVDLADMLLTPFAESGKTTGMSNKRITTEEAAARLGVSARRIRQLCNDGTLTAERFGRKNFAICEASIKRAAKRPRQWRR
ncbi:MAG: helix-turn-helix domain-containing protein, partial [Smithellaceae bacterium]